MYESCNKTGFDSIKEISKRVSPNNRGSSLIYAYMYDIVCRLYKKF